MSKERKCSGCAWFGTDGLCHHEPERLAVLPTYWCRHWSETTGWDVFEKQEADEVLADTRDFEIADLQENLRLQKGLLRLAAELFERDVNSLKEEQKLGFFKDEPEKAHHLGVRERWLEEYRTKC